MDLNIDSSSGVPIRRQLTEQLIFLIATERLAAGELLPSVRELARRLKVHHNTVSEAYQDLVQRKWLERRRGSRLAVLARETDDADETLDDLINRTITRAREKGYSLQQLRERVRERLLAQPPDHLLVVEQDAELRNLICQELRVVVDCEVEGCSREELETNPGLAVGALAVTPHHALRYVQKLFPKQRPAVSLRYSDADEHLRFIRALKRPSVVAVVSSSALFLDVARSILAPAMGSRHELREIHLPSEAATAARSADVVFCDSIAIKSVRLAKAIHYSLLAKDSMKYVTTALESYREVIAPDATGRSAARGAR
jgi:DNA-binding transcriptional regulator YhcF (GntR family)